MDDVAQSANPAFAEKFFRVVEFVVAALICFGLGWWLISPFYSSKDKEGDISEPSDKDYVLDCFIVRDASVSPIKNQYSQIESSLLEKLNTNAGDRISFAIFGGDTKPNPIQPPTTNKASIEAQRGLVNGASYETTDFALLFRRLRDTIYQDRKAQVAAKRPPHADAIIILSDGIPDLSSHESTCPDGSEGFISKDIIDSFDALINSSYATQEPIFVRLIVAGAPSPCAPRIVEEWETSLSQVPGSRSFSAVLFDDLRNAERGILEPLRRQPRIIFSLANLTNSERQHLDDYGAFSVMYSARSFLLRSPGKLEIEHGTLIPRDQGRGEGGGGATASESGEAPRAIQLLALKYPGIPSTDPQSRVVVSPPPHSGQSLLGEAVKGLIYFRLENPEDKNSLAELSKYDLRLTYSSDTNLIVEFRPATLALEPCSRAFNRRALWEKLKATFTILSGITVIYLTGLFCWCVAARRPSRKPFHIWSQKLFYNPRCHWVGALMVLVIPMTTSTFYLNNSIEMMIGFGLVLSLTLHFFEKFKHSPTISLLSFMIEWLSIPLVHFMAVHK